jgi:L-alanine-DL-glutamate epimerase-like enolase superfamily enzyme
VSITDVEPIVVRNEDVDPERAEGTQDAFLVRVDTGEGVAGVGEADTALWREYGPIKETGKPGEGGRLVTRQHVGPRGGGS